MWSPDRPCWRIGVSARQLVRVRLRGLWPRRAVDHDSIACAAPVERVPWRDAVDGLAQWLAAETGRPPTVQVVLSASLLRWQLLPWRPELTHQSELAAFAQLRYAETFGKAAGEWQVMIALQPPGSATPACAVDAALVQALHAACARTGAQLDLVVPYFGHAVDHWRARLGAGTVWFGLIESDWLTLGLLRAGAWQSLRAQRLDGDWRAVLPGLMARMGVAAGGVPAAAKLFLAGTGAPPATSAELPFSWLCPSGLAGLGSDARRLALGV